MILFLGANVLFSAVRNPEGRAAAIIELAGHGLCSLVSSPHAVEEARRNLDLKHPELAPRLAPLLSMLRICRESSPEGVAWAEAEGLPLKDAPILAAAVEARADLLVTGDRAHFGRLYGRKVRGLEVVPTATALARLLKALA